MEDGAVGGDDLDRLGRTGERDLDEEVDIRVGRAGQRDGHAEVVAQLERVREHSDAVAGPDAVIRVDRH